MDQLRDKRGGDWFWTNNTIVDNYLPVIGTDVYAVYSVLTRHAADNGQTAFPKHELIMEKTGLSKPTVVKAIEILEIVGLVTKEKRYAPIRRKDGSFGERRTSNLYTLFRPLPHLDEETRKVFTQKIEAKYPHRRRGKWDLPLPDEGGVNPIDSPGVNPIDSGSDANLVGQEPMNLDPQNDGGGVNGAYPNKTHGLTHEQDSDSSATFGADAPARSFDGLPPQLQAPVSRDEPGGVEYTNGHGPANKPTRRAPPTALQQAIIDGWFALADAQRARREKVPELPIHNNRESWAKFVNAVKGTEKIAIAFGWSPDDVATYIAEGFRYDLARDAKRAEPYWTGRSYYLGSLNKALRAWWTEIKQPQIARAATLITINPAEAQHIQDVARRNAARLAAAPRPQRRVFLASLDDEDENET